MTLISDSTASTTPTSLVFERASKGRQRASWFTAEDADDANERPSPWVTRSCMLRMRQASRSSRPNCPRG
jgi:hypothetical protein